MSERTFHGHYRSREFKSVSVDVAEAGIVKWTGIASSSPRASIRNHHENGTVETASLTIMSAVS